MENHEYNCGCGEHHDHSHNHPEGCGCGQHHPPVRTAPSAPLTETQTAFLDYLNHHRFLPVARFVMLSSKDEDFSVISLAPVLIQTPQDTLEQVKELGGLLSSLEESGHISIDYDLPLTGYAYEEFHHSELYAYFCKTVAEAAGREGFLGDTPALELGSIAPL